MSLAGFFLSSLFISIGKCHICLAGKRCRAPPPPPPTIAVLLQYPAWEDAMAYRHRPAAAIIRRRRWVPRPPHSTRQSRHSFVDNNFATLFLYFCTDLYDTIAL